MHMHIARGRPQNFTRSCGEKTENGAEATCDNQAKNGLVECQAISSDAAVARREP
jgi:hypothetical protein